MQAHELINTIQRRLRKTIEFGEVTVGHYPSAEFQWGGNTFLAVATKSKVNVVHKVGTGLHYQTLHSKYLQGIFDGGVRDDAGTLVVLEHGPAV